MAIIIFFIGAIIGTLLNLCINTISYKLSKHKSIKINIWVVLVTGIIFFIAFLKYQQSNLMLIKSMILGSLLIVVSFIDLKHRIIPNIVVMVTLIIGIIFSFIGDISFASSMLGMMVGGGLLFIFAIIPGAMGGGDIKLMFALGAYLGHIKILWALILAFIVASIISIILILFKIKSRKDYIPFAPFLALGTFISFLFF
jgi:leader peptidase (prepilin peptidase)/N-methyltransferase